MSVAAELGLGADPDLAVQRRLDVARRGGRGVQSRTRSPPAPAVDVTVTTTSSCEPAHPARTSRNVGEQGDQRGRPGPGNPPMGDRRTVVIPFDAQVAASAARDRTSVARGPSATTVGRGREVPVTAECRRIAGRTPGSHRPQSSEPTPISNGSGCRSTPNAARTPSRISRASAIRSAVLPPRLVSARVCLLDTATRPPGPGIALGETGPFDQPGRRQLDRSGRSAG